MGKKNDGGPAYPIQAYVNIHRNEIPGSDGMSLRDWFAGQALAGLLSRCTDLCVDHEGASAAAYEHADAMIARRDKETTDE